MAITTCGVALLANNAYPSTKDKHCTYTYIVGVSGRKRARQGKEAGIESVFVCVPQHTGNFPYFYVHVIEDT